jgi:biopolymer transport protein ExbD
MSHGAAGDSGIKAEPNLVPLLDLVFQLIMFFIICVNFVSDQVDQGLKLPVAQSARAMDKGEIDVLILNMRAEGKIKIVGEPKLLESKQEIRYYLQRQYENARARARERGEKDAQVKTAIVIRADQNVTYEQVFQLLSYCKEQGYRKLQLRAYPRAGN